MPLKLRNMSELEPRVFALMVEGHPVTADTSMSSQELWQHYEGINKLLYGKVVEIEKNAIDSITEDDREVGWVPIEKVTRDWA